MTGPSPARRAIAAARSWWVAPRADESSPRLQLLVTAAWLAVMVTTTTVRTGRAELLDAALVVALLGCWAPLLVRRRRPAVALAGTLLAESLVLVYLSVPDPVARATGSMGAYQPVPLATMLAVGTLAARVPRRTGWVAGSVAGALLALVGFATHSSQTLLTDLVVFYLVVTAAAVGVWLSGRWERRQRLARERAEHTEQAVHEERLRIARELHDVLAHNLTLVNAQAGVARYLLRSDPGTAEQALRDITQHTGRAIDELRATVGLLRGRGEPDATGDQTLRPVPGLAALDDLVTALRAAGVDVRLTRTGPAGPLDQHVDLAGYRIVQEALTNAAKHAPGTPVEVTVDATDAHLRLRVVNGPRSADRAPAPPGTGNGLIGMHERATAAGGTLHATATPDGGFAVVATLPSTPAPGDPA